MRLLSYYPKCVLFKMSPPVPKKSKLSTCPIHAELSETRNKSKEVAVDPSRVRQLVHSPGFLNQECQAVAYWMSRDQRVQDNWALLHAQSIAVQHGYRPCSCRLYCFGF